jgi:tetratricopeptide (TPR) repeat protein
MGDAFEFVFLRTLPEDDPRKDSLVSDVFRRFDLAKKGGRASAIAKWRAYKQLVAKLDGLADISAHQAEIEIIIASKAWAADQALEEKAAVDESALREIYVPQIGTKRVEDWRKMAHQLRTAHGKNQWPQHQMDLRVLNFLSLNVYFQVDGALKAGNLPQAEHFLQIYAIIDPANPEHAYLKAVLRMRQGRHADALAALQAAQRLGFKDADRMATDPEFAGLQGQPLFSELVEQMRTAG